MMLLFSELPFCKKSEDESFVLLFKIVKPFCADEFEVNKNISTQNNKAGFVFNFFIITSMVWCVLKLKENILLYNFQSGF